MQNEYSFHSGEKLEVETASGTDVRRRSGTDRRRHKTLRPLELEIEQCDVSWMPLSVKGRKKEKPSGSPDGFPFLMRGEIVMS